MYWLPSNCMRQGTAHWVVAREGMVRGVYRTWSCTGTLALHVDVYVHAAKRVTTTTLCTNVLADTSAICRYNEEHKLLVLETGSWHTCVTLGALLSPMASRSPPPMPCVLCARIAGVVPCLITTLSIWSTAPCKPQYRCKP